MKIQEAIKLIGRKVKYVGNKGVIAGVQKNIFPEGNRSSRLVNMKGFGFVVIFEDNPLSNSVFFDLENLEISNETLKEEK